jgi:hypothetical protein
MATIDPSIALGVKPIQIENPMNQYAALSQIQTGQNQNALAQYQLSSAKRADEKVNFLNQSISKNTNPETGQINYSGVYKDAAQNNFGSLIPELKAKEAETQGKEIINKKNVEDTKTAAIKNIREKTSDLQFNPSDDNIRAHAQDAVLRGVWTPDEAKQNVAMAIALPMNQRPAYFAQRGLDAEKRITVPETIRHNKKTEDISQQNANTSAFSAATQAKSVANAANPDLQAALSEAKARGEFFGKNKAAAAAALPGAIASAKQTINLIDEMVGKELVKDKKGNILQQKTEPLKGFNAYVGTTLLPGQRFIEGSDAASFEIRQKQIEGKAFLEAFEALKGGGSITEKEGEKGTQAIMRMNKAASKDEYIKAARELQEVLRIGIETKSTKAGVPLNSGSNSIDNLVDKYTK